MINKALLIGALVLTNGLPFIVYADEAVIVTSQVKAEDTRITALILGMYQQSPILTKQAISVVTQNQQVALRGKLDSVSQYEQAVALAESVEGVGYVNADNLLVKASNAPLTDAYLTAKVRGSVLKEKLFGTRKIEYWPIKIETKNNTVYLSGKVKSNVERSTLIKLAKSVKGVSRVKSALTVQS